MLVALAVELLLVAVSATSAAGQATPPQRPDCSASDHRHLDFWIGEWVVSRTADNVRIGDSRIESIMKGCAIKESFDSPNAPGGPYAGTSYSGFDRKDNKWHQMYVDVNGNVTWFTGGLDGGSMTMTAPGRSGSIQRMVYTPEADGSVRQVGTSSTDQGKTWQAGYDYTYRRKTAD